jgi:hypothetical protein
MKNNMKVIGVTGLARTGKDIYCKIATRILTDSGFVVKKYAFADTLKNEVLPFLRDVCGVDVWTDDTEIKTDIRDFLVWYGTTFWRKREPNRWIKNVEIQLDKDKPDVALISDVRYPNEGHWIHSQEGFLVHLSKYTKQSPDGGQTWIRRYQTAPNAEEAKNDPQMQMLANFKIVWEDLINDGTVKISPEELAGNMYLREEVFKSLQACPGFY